MQQHWVVLMLLVVTSISIAHGQTFEINKDLMTSQLAQEEAVVEMDESNLDLDNVVTIRTPSSAVQDWSLVCQQLCGAALGGAACASHCENLSFLPFDAQLENADYIMDSKRELICPELCGLQLGDDVCTCKNYATKELDAFISDEQQTNVCAIFCEHNPVTLTGCTPCKGQGAEPNNKHDKFDLNKFQSFLQKEVAPLEATTAITPDWQQLCAALCKTGDGGSLCNCDLSPFKIKRFDII